MILVTGGAGFIGSHTCAALAEQGTPGAFRFGKRLCLHFCPHIMDRRLTSNCTVYIAQHQL